MPKVILRYLGKDGSPWCVGVPARDLTQADLDTFGLTEEGVLAIVKPDGTPLYEKIKTKRKEVDNG